MFGVHLSITTNSLTGRNISCFTAFEFSIPLRTDLYCLMATRQHSPCYLKQHDRMQERCLKIAIFISIIHHLKSLQNLILESKTYLLELIINDCCIPAVYLCSRPNINGINGYNHNWQT